MEVEHGDSAALAAVDASPWLRPAIGAVRTGCLCCPPKDAVAPLDWQPHPGFGMLNLTRDGEAPDWWCEFSELHRWTYYIDRGWYDIEVVAGPRKGEIVQHFDGDWHIDWIAEAVTLREIEECCAEDPDHDWRLTSEGPLGGVIYQRHSPRVWVAIERLDGFA